MEFNKRLNPFLYGFFTSETDTKSYIFRVHIDSIEATAKFAIQQGKLPEIVFPNELKEVTDFKYNSKDGTFTSKIGNGRFVKAESNEYKIVFDNFRYDNVPNLELIFDTRLNNNLRNHVDDGVKK